MITHKTKWLLVGLVCLALWPAYTSAQGGLWQTYIAAGAKAYQQGDYAQAEKQWSAALKEAEGFGPQDPRLATSLDRLATLYQAKGSYTEAEPLFQRALAIVEKALGPDHPSVATSLNNLGLVYHAQGKYAEAEQLFQRSLAISEKALGRDDDRRATSVKNQSII